MDAKIEINKSQLSSLSQKIYAYPEKVAFPNYFQAMQSLVANAAEVGRGYIQFNPNVITPTGEKRVASGVGRYATRYVSGDLAAGFKWVGVKTNNRKYTFKMGWVTGEPAYSIFQEYGTKNGIVGMDALGYATEFLRKELKILEVKGATYGRRSQGIFEEE
jgi:hypothetical protein